MTDFHHSPLILVRHSWLCSQLFQVLLIILLLSCFFHTSSSGVLQGGVLGRLLFVIYTTPCSSDSKTNLPKYTTLHFTPLTVLEILASSLTNILLSVTKLQLSPKPVTITFVNFAASGLVSLIRQFPYHCCLYRPLQI